jgi:hypothetical protein
LEQIVAGQAKGLYHVTWIKHSHAAFQEAFYIIEGQIQVITRGKTYIGTKLLPSSRNLFAIYVVETISRSRIRFRCGPPDGDILSPDLQGDIDKMRPA